MKVEIESVGFGFAHGFGLKYIGVKVATPEGETYNIGQDYKIDPSSRKYLNGRKKGGLLEIYFKINGKLNEPKVIPQPHKSLIEKPEAILKKIIKISKNLSK